MTTVTAASPPQHAASQAVGKNDLGTITVADAVVRKIASRAAVEVADAGSAAPRIVGKTIDASALGLRGTSLSGLPKTSVRVDGRVAMVEMTLSVRWPCPVPAVTQQVRDHVRERVANLTGLSVAEVNIQVTDLVTSLPRPPRVQ